MAVRDPSYRDGPTGGANPVASISFSDIVPGVPTSEVPVWLWNDFALAGTDPLRNGRVIATGRIKGATTEFLGAGLGALDSMVTQVRIVSSNDPTIAPTSFVGMGAGSALDVPILDSGIYVELSFRIVVPGFAASTAAVELDLVLDDAPSFFVGTHVANVVTTREGNSAATYLAERAAATVSSGLSDGTVTTGAHTWIHKGIVRREAAGPHVFDNLDGSAAALVATEAYAVAFTLGATGITTTKGDKATSPLTTANLPTLPTGEELTTWLEVPFGLLIVFIFDVATPQLFDMTSSALDLTVGPGTGFSDGFDVRRDTASLLPLPDDDVSIVFVVGGTGSMANVLESGDPPLGNPLLIGRVVTAAGVVTEAAPLSPPSLGGA